MANPKPGFIDEGYVFRGGDPNDPANWAPLAKQQRSGVSELVRGLRRGASKAAASTIGMVADVPQNIHDLTQMAIAPLEKMVFGELPQIDPRRVASSYIMERSRPLWEFQPSGAIGRAAYTAGEVGMAGLLSGGATGGARGLTYNLALPMAGGVAGEALGGERGKLIGAVGLPLATGAAEAGIKALARAGATVPPQQSMAALQAAGVPPVAGDVGPIMGTTQRAVETTPLGYAIGKRAAERRGQAISGQLETLGKDISEEVAGRVVKQGVGDWTQRFQNKYRALQAVTRQIMPDNTPVEMSNTQTVLDDLLAQPASVEAMSNAGDLKRFSSLQEALTVSQGRVGAAELRALRTQVGTIAYPKSVIVGDVDTAKYERLWKAMSQDLEGAAQSVGPAAVKAMARENRFYSSGRERLREYFDGIANQADPKRVFNSLMSGTKRGITEVRTTMKSLTPEQRDAVAAAQIVSMGKPIGSRVETGFSAETFLTRWRNLSDESKVALFSGGTNPQLRKTLDTLARATQVTRETARYLPNPSGSGAAAVSGGLVASALWRPVEAMVAIGGTGALEYLFTRPWFAKWLAAGKSLPPQAMQGHLIRFQILAGQDPLLSETQR